MQVRVEKTSENPRRRRSDLEDDRAGSVRRLLVVVTISILVGAACSSGGDGVVVDAPRDGDLAGADGGSETVEGPGFEVELQPGEDPDDVIAEGGAPAPTTPPAPDDALAGLCPSLESVVTGTATDAERDEVQRAAPDEWASDLADLSDPAALIAIPSAAAIDRFFYESCSVPLLQGALLVGSGCADRDCRTARVDELGGLCFDDDGAGTNPYRLLSCVSGLPA